MKSKFHVKIKFKVPYCDIDKLGHVNNATYLSYFESARVAYFRNIPGLNLSEMDEKSATGIIISEIGIKYLAPAYLDQVIEVGLRVSEVRTKGFRMEYEIRDRKTKALLTIGHSVQVMYNYKKQTTYPIGMELRKIFEKIEKRTF
ncbi:MAG: acyl-CoA thioesterase [Deltaproteobacteria bacterium]|nr:MAG: acyl-CoA thioesterase [Deltaproteobacteria bacterium]